MTQRVAVAHAGKMLLELAYLWSHSLAHSPSQKICVEGKEVVDAALAKGKGLVLLTPHLGSFEAAAQGYAAQFGDKSPMTALYRPPRQTWLREWVDQARSRPGLRTAPATLSGVRQLLRALRNGETVGILPDQVPPEGMGVWADFFSKPAYTMTLVSRLIKQTQAEILVCWGERLPKGKGFVVRFEHFGGPSQSQKIIKEVTPVQINLEMERMIQGCPSQYLWGYNRYKKPRSVSK